MASMVAVDLGAQSGRVAVGRLEDGRLSVEEVHRFPNVPVRVRGMLHWDILRLYRDVLDGLRGAARGRDDVVSLGVDSWAVDFGLLDRRGRLVQNPVNYRDERRAAALPDVLARVPARELYARTGIQILGINTLCELAAMAAEDDPALEAAETLLLIPDLLHYWLSGTRVCEFTNATTTQLVDAQTGTWSAELMERFGIDGTLFPDIVPPSTALGLLAADTALETGLDRAALVAVGTHDTASAVAAVPFRTDGAAFISAGTWSLVGIEVDAPTITDETFAANLTNEGGVGGTYRLLRNVAGLWLLHECRRVWQAEGTPFTFEELSALALDAEPLGSLVDPDDAVFAAPGDMPRRVREYCAATHQAIPEGPAEITRCILESLALAHAQAVSAVGTATGSPIPEINIVGGGARNASLCSWTAAAAGVPVVAGPEEATLVGNLLQQAIALGELDSLDDARAVVRASFPATVFEPADTAAWGEARDRFAHLRRASAPSSWVAA